MILALLKFFPGAPQPEVDIIWIRLFSGLKFEALHIVTSGLEVSQSHAKHTNYFERRNFLHAQAQHNVKFFLFFCLRNLG